MATDKETTNSTECGMHVCSCFKKSFSWSVYILMYIGPIIIQSSTLAYYSDDFSTVSILLISYSCFIIAATLYMGIKLIIDLRHDDSEGHRKCNCSNAFGVPLYKPKSLLRGGHWFMILLPWILCNIVSIGYFGKQIINANSQIIIIMAFIPFGLFPIAGGCGFGISREIEKAKEKKNKKTKKINQNGV
jgi:hypothetical protein